MIKYIILFLLIIFIICNYNIYYIGGQPTSTPSAIKVTPYNKDFSDYSLKQKINHIEMLSMFDNLKTLQKNIRTKNRIFKRYYKYRSQEILDKLDTIFSKTDKTEQFNELLRSEINPFKEI